MLGVMHFLAAEVISSQLFQFSLISIAASLIALVFGSMAAYALVRFQFRVKLLAGIVFASCGMGSYLLKIFDWKDTTSMALLFFVLCSECNKQSTTTARTCFENNDIVFWFVHSE